MPSSEILPFIMGFLGFLILWFTLFSISRSVPIFKTAIAKTSNSRDLVLFILNLSIVAAGISISVFALVVAEGGETMTPAQLHPLIASAQELTNWVWAIFGAATAIILLYIVVFIKAIIDEMKRKHLEENKKTTIKDAGNKESPNNKLPININMNISITDDTKSEQFMSIKEIIDKVQKNSKGNDDK